MKYYLVYNLGLTDTPNIKTEKGTVVHAALECLAGMQKSYQDTGKYEYTHPGAGLFVCDPKEFKRMTILTDKEVDVINKSRKNKQTYIDQKYLEYGHKRFGVDIVSEAIDRCYNYYSEKSDLEWTNIEYRDCVNFTWMELDWANGEFDPRNRKVIYPELPFNIEIKEPWAKISDNEYLRIKGTIDLVTDAGDNTIEIIDYKTGARYDWGKGKVKDYDALMKDKQLMLYYYAARKALPKFDTIMLTIFFIRDGGPFTLCFDDNILQDVENNLKTTFDEIRNCTKPKLLDNSHIDFRCNKLCGFYKTKVEKMCQCDYIKNEIDVYGFDQATIRNRKSGFQVGTYQSPGE